MCLLLPEVTATKLKEGVIRMPLKQTNKLLLVLVRVGCKRGKLL